jgi:hypothetical protein
VVAARAGAACAEPDADDGETGSDGQEPAQCAGSQRSGGRIAVIRPHPRDSSFPALCRQLQEIVDGALLVPVYEPVKPTVTVPPAAILPL